MTVPILRVIGMTEWEHAASSWHMVSPHQGLGCLSLWTQLCYPPPASNSHAEALTCCVTGLGVWAFRKLLRLTEVSSERGFLCGSAGKECNVGDLRSIPGLERSPGEGKGYPLQYSGEENSHGWYSSWGCNILCDWAWRLGFYLGSY